MFVRFLQRLRQRRRRRGNFRRGHAPSKPAATAHVLDAHLLSSREAQRIRQTRAKLALKIGGAAVALVAFGTGARAVMTKHLWSDAARTVRLADIQTNGRLTHEEILQRAGLGPDQHIYDVDLKAARERLEQFPAVKQATVERETPGRLVINVEERVPTAWLACDNPPLKPFTTKTEEGACLLDDEGVIFTCAELTSELLKLPVIHVRRLPNTQPGAKTGDPVQASLKALALSRKTLGPRNVDIVELDSPNDWSIVAKLTDDSVITLGYDDLDGQFTRLRRIYGLASENNKRLATVNLLPKKNVPVTYFNAAADARPATPAGVKPASGAPPAKAPSRPAPAPPTTDAQLEEILGGGN